MADTDMNGHVNNGAIGAFCEAGRSELMAAAGGAAAGRDFAMAVVRVAIDFRREIHYPGRVRIGSAVTRLGSSSITLEQGLFMDGLCFATSDAVMVILDRATRRPVPIPQAVRDRCLSLAPPGVTPGP